MPNYFLILMFQAATTFGVIIINLGLVGAIVLSSLWGLSKVDITLFITFYLISAFGITVGYHRYFTHKSFKTYKIVSYLLCIFGSMAAQGSLSFWVGKHRVHHHHTEKKHDPHSPVSTTPGFISKLRSFFHGHMGWLFVERSIEDYKKRINDIVKNSTLFKIQNLYWLWLLLGILLPGILGGILSGSWKGFLTGMLWGGIARICILHHVTWSVNSICHLFGTRTFSSKDNSKNNFLVALLSLGEGYHNNHHAFAYSAKQGLRFWQIDFSYLLIKLLSKIGIVWDIKIPTIASMKNKMLSRKKK